MTVSKSTRIISVNTCSNAMRIAMILGYYTFILHWIDIGTFDRRCQFTDQAFIKHVVALVAKNPPASAGDKREVGLIPGSGRFPGGGHGNPLHYSCLENPLDRGAWRATVHEVTESRTRLKWPSRHMRTLVEIYFLHLPLLLIKTQPSEVSPQLLPPVRSLLSKILISSDPGWTRVCTFKMKKCFRRSEIYLLRKLGPRPLFLLSWLCQ